MPQQQFCFLRACCRAFSALNSWMCCHFLELSVPLEPMFGVGWGVISVLPLFGFHSTSGMRPNFRDEEKVSPGFNNQSCCSGVYRCWTIRLTGTNTNVPALVPAKLLWHDLFTCPEFCPNECDRSPRGGGTVHRSPFTVQSNHVSR
eukprot:365053-Chlamydomonas_euryale.AAC.6